MRSDRLKPWARALTAAVLMVTAIQPAFAQGGPNSLETGLAAQDDGDPPPLDPATGQGVLENAPLVVACSGDVGVLYCQLDNVPGSDIWVASQDYIGTTLTDSSAADDFEITTVGGVKSWQITAVRVSGRYEVGSVQNVLGANVRFYLDNGSQRPGAQIWSGVTAAVSSTTMSSGEFYMTLSPVPNFAANGKYWVSVQALKNSGNPPQGVWGWRVAQPQSGDSGVWQQPGNAHGSGCITWQPLGTCFPGTPPDLRYSLIGVSSTITSTSPILTSMWPPGGINEDVTLTLRGYNFAPGAVISWTVQPTPTTTIYTPSFVSANNIVVTIPAADLTVEGQQAAVRVVNPEPCFGICASGALTFIVDTFYFSYHPFVGR